MGSPSPTEISSNQQQQPQPIPAKSPPTINNENIHLNNFDNLQKLFFQPNISYNSLAQSNLAQALLLLQQNNYNNNQISANFRPIVTPSK
ncbi:unnamed protein product [Meloidogyne enterolobii]|uniref:Uncharacterized protein n=1 Tax=Meloidogyne enterolobii TaxID=390850 RepID=A0ACB0ZKC2_MELEN